MGRIPRGRAVIVNNQKFKKFLNDKNELKPRLKYRKGSEHDRDKLKALFEKLGFTVDIWENKKGEVCVFIF